MVGRQEGQLVCKKTEWCGAGIVICLERGADLHMSQLIPLPLTVSCFSKIQIGFTFLVLANPGSSTQRAVKWVCVCDQKFRSLLTVLPNRAPTNLGAPHSERQLFWFFQVTERSGAGVVTCLVRGSDYSYMVWPLVHYPETSIFLASLKSRMVYLSGTSLPWMS